MKSITLGKKIITADSEPYIIAEIGVNHEGSFDLAKRLIELAREGGADAAKFQTYKAGLIASKFSPSYWDLTKESTRSQFELFKKYDAFGPQEYEKLARHCEDVGIDFLSTPFDLDAVDFLNPLVPFFKIASADITNIPLLKKVAVMQKPVILSTGASRLDEIDQALLVLRNAGAKEIGLLHCILNYPTPDEFAHLNMIEDLQKRYADLIVGFSDHTVPDESMTTLTTAYLKGARILEKHFTHDKSLPGNDHYHAMTADDLKNYFRQVRKIRKLEGAKEKAPIISEAISRQNARRSLVLSRAVKKDEVITEEHLICKRPGIGISPTRLAEVLGKRSRRDLEEDHILRFQDLVEDRKNIRVVGLIQARVGSTRFPRKIFAQLGNLSILEWVLGRVQQAQELQEVVLAIPEGEKDDELAQAAEKLGTKVFRGSESDVLHRFVQAARVYNADAVVRICADNPFVDGGEIDRLVQQYRNSDSDYLFNHIPRLDNNYPDGLGAEIVSRAVLEDLYDKTFLPEHREHVTKYIWDYPDSYSMATLQAPPEWARPELKFDVDTREDLQKLQAIAEKIKISFTPSELISAWDKR